MNIDLLEQTQDTSSAKPSTLIERSFADDANTLEQMGVSTSAIGIHSPLVSFEDRLYFVKTYVNPDVTTIYDGKRNTLRMVIAYTNPKTSNEKIWNRVGYYLRTGKISFATLSTSDEKETLCRLIADLNMRFNLYIRANDTIVKRISETLRLGQEVFDKHYSGLSNLYHEEHSEPFGNTNNTTNLKSNVLQTLGGKTVEALPYKVVPKGVHPNWSVRVWQTDFINATRARFLWCNAFGTGLGKTSTALLSVQDRQNRYAGERAVFVVPASSLNKWFQEAFVGTFKKGVQIKPSVYLPELEAKSLFINLMLPKTYKQLIAMTPEMVEQVYAKEASIKYIYQHKERFAYLAKTVDEQLELALLTNEDGSFVYDKVFMTHQHFYRLRMREESVNEYIQYQTLVDSSFANLNIENPERYDNKIDGFMRILHKESGGKNKRDLFFEDMKFDILVVDEAHVYKNNRELFNNDMGSSVSNVRFFPNSVASNRGIDLLAKAYWTRNRSATHEGILCLTATPITNSPLEIYGVASLVVGEYFVNQVIGVKNPQDFLSLLCIIEDVEGAGIDDNLTIVPTFQGLDNLKLLHNLMSRIAYAVDENDERVGGEIKLPLREKKIIKTDMNAKQLKLVEHLKTVYRLLRKVFRENELKGMRPSVSELFQMVGDGLSNSDKHFIEKSLAHFHEYENVEITTSPFNLMNKFERLIVDEDLLEAATVMFFNKPLLPYVQKALETFNNKKFKYTATRLHPQTQSKAIASRQEKLDANDNISIQYQIYEMGQAFLLNEIDSESITHRLIQNAYNPQSAIQNHNTTQEQPECMVVLDTLEYQNQWFFFDTLVDVIKAEPDFITSPYFQSLLQQSKHLLQQHIDFIGTHNDTHCVYTKQDVLRHAVSLALRFNLSPKVRECLAKFKYECENPRGKNYDGANTNIVKQLVFCDEKGLHYKLMHLMFQEAGMPLNKIAVLTGTMNGANDEVLELQDAFNAEDDENIYQVVIANEKGEYAIDLQNGTQAVHLLSLFWTPDSETQRVGRAARQGNQTDVLHIYDYLMNKTFDEYKRSIVNSKARWINQLFEGKVEHAVRMMQLFDKDQQEKMLMMIGDVDENLLKEQQEAQERERLERETERVARAQNMLLDFIFKTPYQVEKVDTHSEQMLKQYKKQWALELQSVFDMRRECIQNLLKENEFVERLFDIVKLNNHNERMLFLSSVGMIDFIWDKATLLSLFRAKEFNRVMHQFNELMLINGRAKHIIDKVLRGMDWYEFNENSKIELQTVSNHIGVWFKDNSQSKDTLFMFLNYVAYINNYVLRYLVDNYKQSAVLHHADERIKRDTFDTVCETGSKLHATAVVHYGNLCESETDFLSVSPDIVKYAEHAKFQNNWCIFPNVFVLNFESEHNTKIGGKGKAKWDGSQIDQEAHMGKLLELINILNDDVDVDKVMSAKLNHVLTLPPVDFVKPYVTPKEYSVWLKALRVLNWVQQNKVNIRLVCENRTQRLYANKKFNGQLFANVIQNEKDVVTATQMNNLGSVLLGNILLNEKRNNVSYQEWCEQSLDLNNGYSVVVQPNLSRDKELYVALSRAVCLLEMLIVLHGAVYDATSGVSVNSNPLLTKVQQFDWVAMNMNLPYSDDGRNYVQKLVHGLVNRTLLVETPVVNNVVQNTDGFDYWHLLSADVAQKLMNADDKHVFTFEHRNSYEIASEIQLRQSLYNKGFTNQFLFYYGNRTALNKKRDQENAQANKKAMEHLGLTYEWLGGKNLHCVWIGNRQMILALLNLIEEHYNTRTRADEFRSVMAGISITDVSMPANMLETQGTTEHKVKQAVPQLHQLIDDYHAARLDKSMSDKVEQLLAQLSELLDYV